MPLFTTLDNRRLVDEIGGARSHVILAAPGIVSVVADALIAAAKRLPLGQVRVVLDVSPRVARLGYGEFSAVTRLKNAGVDLRHHCGLRLGVLICDDHGWSFASAARLVEADPTADTDAFNAIVLSTTQVLALRAELPQVGPDEQEAVLPIVGEQAVTDSAIEAVETALNIAPAQHFDLARQTQVFTTMIQFVELTFEGFNIQSRRVQLPASLPMLASKDNDLKARLSASLKVLDKVEQPKALKDIAAALEELRNAYLMPVGHAGRVMLKGKQVEFEKELAGIVAKLELCKKDLVSELEKALERVITSITPELARAVMADPPARFRGLFPATVPAASAYVEEELRRYLPGAEKLVQGMRVHRFYKDVTYETLKDDEFRARVLEQIPKSMLEGALLDEFTAAKAGKEE